MNAVSPAFGKIVSAVLVIVFAVFTGSPVPAASAPEIDPVALEYIMQLIEIEDRLQEGDLAGASAESSKLSKALAVDHPEVARHAADLGAAQDIETAKKRFHTLEEKLSSALGQ